MPTLADRQPLTALIYASGTDPGPVLASIAEHLATSGLRCAGFVQRDVPRPGRSRCDMVLHDIASGCAIPISEDRGPGSRGCRLDEGELARAMMAAMEALATGPDVLFINKFGKSEAEGRGFRPLIAAALEHGVPVLIAVSWQNIESWRLFAGDFAHEIDIAVVSGDPIQSLRHLGFGAYEGAKHSAGVGR